jgi:hypothetical protein
MCFLASFSACAVHIFDPESGTHHLIGLGYAAFRVSRSPEEIQSVVRGADQFGLSVGYAKNEGISATVGWNRTQRLEIVDPDASIRLEGQSADLFDVVVGVQPPLESLDAAKEQTP